MPEIVNADLFHSGFFENDRSVGLSNICYTPINKFPQNSLW